ncbi:MAG TPA: alpha/beta-type small acid-soluble spore protein [Gallicola sp.]|nr:alpha/beta-type small acid-soluble spore protein [Gallicola sp.]
MANRSKTDFNKLKYEVANELGVNLKQGYNGDLSAREAGAIGGNIVRKVFESYTGNNYYTGQSDETQKNR